MERRDFSPQFSLTQTNCRLSTRMNVSFTISAGWILAGKPWIPSQARLPLFSMPSGVFSSRNMTMPKPSSHFQRLAASVRSIWDMRK